MFIQLLDFIVYIMFYRFVEEEISRFIGEMTCTGTIGGAKSASSLLRPSSKNLERMKSYQSFTPLNNKVLPDLLK